MSRFSRMTYIEAKAARDQISLEVDAASARVNSFPKSVMGLVPDAVKFTTDYRAAKTAFDASFSKLQKFNQTFTRQFASEIRAERRARRAA